MGFTAEQELTLGDILHILRRRRWTIVVITAVVFLLSIVAALLTTRRYEATSVVDIEREGSDALQLNTLTGDTNHTNALASEIEIQTQASLMQSNTLALRVINRLHLTETPDFKKKLKDAKVPASFDENTTVIPPSEAIALATFHRFLSVVPSSGTHLLNVSFMSSEPTVAATVVNELIQDLILENFETHAKATQVASAALGRDLTDLRSRSEQLQTQVARMQVESGIYSAGTTDAQGRQQAYSAVLEQFQRSATTLSNTAENRILKQGIAEAARSGDAESLSSLAGNGATSGAITTSLTTLQTLRTQEATLQGQLDQLKTKFGPGYPRVAELQANLSSIEQEIRRETGRIGQRAQTDYNVANRTYQDAQNHYNQLKGQADTLNSKTIQYLILKQESDETRSLYEDLLRRLKEAGIIQSLRPSPVRVVDPALVPLGPKRPNVPIYLAGGLLGGVLLGLLGALILDVMNPKIQDAEALSGLGIPLAGLLPGGQGAPGRASAAYAEAVRSIRAELSRPANGEAPVIILVAGTTATSGLAGTLAASFAAQQRRTLLLHADFVSPGSPDLRGTTRSGGPGLSEALLGGSGKVGGAAEPGNSGGFGGTGSLTVEPVAADPRFPLLMRLHEGAHTQEAADLLGTPAMKRLLDAWRQRFSIIVIEGPPLIPYAESRALAPLADAVLQTARVGETTTVALKRSHDLISTFAARPVAVVLEAGKQTNSLFERYYGSKSTVGHPRGRQQTDAA